MHFETWQWILGALAAFMVGTSKTGIPGVGILVVTLLGSAFGGWSSNGIMLPMLIFGDVFAVAWYRRHAQWGMLVRLLPWVLVGVAVGGVGLHYFGKTADTKKLLNPVIGGMVLVMLALNLLQGRFSKYLEPKSRAGVITTGAAAGFATTISNAAGPIMAIFLSAQKFPKEQFMGTLAWYFLLINLTKVPVYIAQGDIFTGRTLLLDLLLVPAILLGVFLGKWIFPRLPQKVFDGAVLLLAAAGAVQLLIPR